MSRHTLMWVGAAALVQLLILGTFGLGVDEAHYVLYARHLDLSYFDHPPLVGWVHALFNFLLGETLFSARVPAVLCGFWFSWNVFRFLRERGFEKSGALWATLGVSFCFQFFVLNLFLLPETLCLALAWPLGRAVVDVAERSSRSAWTRLGIFLGLMGLAKYTAVFFVVPVAVVLLSARGWRLFLSPGLWVAVLLALFLISPVVIWNAQHDWISFRYQLGHVLGTDHGFETFWKSLAVQFAIYSPFLFPWAWWGFFQLRKDSAGESRFWWWTALTFGAFFIWSSWKAAVLPHWMALFYALPMAWGLAQGQERFPRLVRTAVVFTAFLMVTVSGLLLTGVGYQIPDALKEVSGWPQVIREVVGRKKPNEGIAVLNWTYGSRALYYGREIENQIFVIDDRRDQFDLWQAQDPWGKDLWIVQFSYDKKDLANFVACESLEEIPAVPIFERGHHVYDLILQHCLSERAP